MLLQRGYLYIPYASLESIIEENKDLYYAALRRTQATLKQKRPDWSPWVLFFLRSLKKQKDNLAAKLKRERVLAWVPLPLSLEILLLLREHERLGISELESLTGAKQEYAEGAAQRVDRRAAHRQAWQGKGDFLRGGIKS